MIDGLQIWFKSFVTHLQVARSCDDKIFSWIWAVYLEDFPAKLKWLQQSRDG